MKKNSWIKRFFSGIGIGIGAAIPGVSGAAIALIFRVYENIIDAINNFRKEFKKSFGTLLPIIIGILIAVVGCVIIFNWAFDHIMFLLICIFAGFLIGSIPSIFTEVKSTPIVPKNIIIAVSSGVIVVELGVLSILLGKNGVSAQQYMVNVEGDSALLSNWWMFIVLFAVGILASVALTIPGFSGSLILLILGFYKPLLNNTISWTKQLFNGVFDNTLSLVLMLVVFALGCVVGVVFVSKVMRKLLDNHHTETYYSIIGFVIGSVPVLFLNYQIWEYYQAWSPEYVGTITPNLDMNEEIIFGIFAIFLCAFISYMIVRMQNNIKNKKK